MQIVHPEIAVFIKYEFWYNYLTAMQKAGTRLYLISAIFRKEQIFFKPYGGLFAGHWRPSPTYLYKMRLQNNSCMRSESMPSASQETHGSTAYLPSHRMRRTCRKSNVLPKICPSYRRQYMAPGRRAAVDVNRALPERQIHHRATRDTRFPHRKVTDSDPPPSLRYTELTPESDLAHAKCFLSTRSVCSRRYTATGLGATSAGDSVQASITPSKLPHLACH